MMITKILNPLNESDKIIGTKYDDFEISDVQIQHYANADWNKNCYVVDPEIGEMKMMEEE